ncbi:MAG: rubrerythrin family protein [Deltaproteobacteria bacterium]|nr:rubrerythrin family protein [Deltaproteobacteria bacterium]
MKKMTEQHLINAFAGESMANMRYRHFGIQAAKEGYPNVSRLFSAISHAEYIHAGDHYRELNLLDGGFVANSMGVFGPGDTLKNLGLSIAGETFEIEEMYPTYMQVAEFQNEKGAFRSFEWSYKTEKMHRSLFVKAKEAVETKKDVELGPVQICEVCGFTLEGDVPDTCPVCGAKKAEFVAFK